MIVSIKEDDRTFTAIWEFKIIDHKGKLNFKREMAKKNLKVISNFISYLIKMIRKEIICNLSIK